MKKIIFTVTLLLLVSTFSYAQEAAEKIFPDSKNMTAEQLNLQNRNEVTNVPESTIIEDKYAGQYQKSTVQNLSKLYWLKGVLKFDNDKAIDNFIRINECEFYKENISKDFKWQKIRTAARQMIKENIPTYSEKFKIIVPVDLGRYDPIKKGFPLVNGTEFDELRRIEVGGNNRPICGKQWAIEYYPKNAHLILNKPFNYMFMDLDEHLAQAYILRNNIAKPERPKEILTKSFNRLAFARIRLRFMEYQGETKEKYRTPVSVLFGKIDGIEIFENADETGLLSSVDY